MSEYFSYIDFFSSLGRKPGCKKAKKHGGDKDNKKYTDFNQVRDNIQKLTDDVAGSGANIVDDPIKLKIYSVDCPDLTIIDLPGITRIDMKGQKDV